ncbi:MAG: YkvA family protein [Lachnospiraceae bacterium]|nr:YkvA family protein [Lachnospiraceae bacterium]MDD3661335.1 YkvA family protein [Lachnospiraceae bacterium]
MDLKQRAIQLKSDIPALFLSLKDQNTPLIAKLFAALTIAYALSPIDLIPDFIPVLGYLDDLIILPALVALTLRFIPKEIFEKNRELAKNIWADGKPKKWYYAIPIIVIWLLLIGIIFMIVV